MKTATPEARLDFARRLTGLLCAVHGPQARADLEPLRQQALENPRFAQYGETFRRQAAQRLREMPLCAAVDVHGDLTGENVLMDGEKIILLDFADGCPGPGLVRMAAAICRPYGRQSGALIRLFVAGMPPGDGGKHLSRRFAAARFRAGYPGEDDPATDGAKSASRRSGCPGTHLL